MWEIVVNMFDKSGKIIGSMKCTKTYTKRGFAERKAKSYCNTVYGINGEEITRKAYVRGFLHPVTKEEAISAYCRDKNIWVDGEHGQKKIRASWKYGSHAPATELFYREINYARGYYCEYEGNYYIEDGN